MRRVALDRVWYVAYGSNLSLARFRCYLTGGPVVGGARVYVGCRDPSDPTDMVNLHAPGGLVFGGRSSVWGGGMAFYDSGADGRVACRAYLVTSAQFADVVAQEIRRAPGGGFARDLVRVLDHDGTVRTTGAGLYEMVARLGVRDGVPMFTITHADVARLVPVSPTAAYLRWIAAGLHESHQWEAGRIGRYLAAAPGVAGSWTAPEIATLARQPCP